MEGDVLNGPAEPVRPYVIVVGNEKGGTGKSTTAMHLAVALNYRGLRAAGIDLDMRQRTFQRFAENRRDFIRDSDKKIPMLDVRTVDTSAVPDDVDEIQSGRDRLNALIDSLRGHDFIIIDTPGSDSTMSRLGHEMADTLVTPINESYVDIDVIARIDRTNREVLAPSVYCQMVWEQHNRRVSEGRAAIDWIVVRNRISHVDSHSRRDVGQLLEVLAKRIGFRLAPGFGERVIFRELFLKGLTLLDLPTVLPETRQSASHQAGRREVWGLLRGVGLPESALVRV